MFEYDGIDSSWLSMFHPIIIRGSMDKSFEREAILSRLIFSISPEIPSYSNISPVSKQVFPLFDGIAAGQPRLMPDGIETYVEFTTSIRADFVLKVHGDSMIGARIHDGDLVFIRQQPEVENGEIAAVAIGDEATLKRVYRYGDTLSLRAENPAYKEMVFTGEELNNIHILGKAIAFHSDIL
jgi:repressor LexA